MNLSEVKSKLGQIAFNLGMTDTVNIDNESFKEIFQIIDSLQLINFVVDIENEFNIELPDEFLMPENFVSLDYVAEYILSMS